MRCAIMQPTYLPWIGYFHMMSSVDIFVLLDDVQFAKRSWQQRNRIVMQGKEHMMTVPVLTKGRHKQRINEVLVDNSTAWHSEHKAKIYHAYSNHPYGEEAISLISNFIDGKKEYLVDLNMDIINTIKNRLQLNTTIIRSSNLPVSGVKSQYLVNICKLIGASSYLSAPGSKDYIEEEALFAKEDIEVIYHQFNQKVYPQRNVEEFIPYMSIIDLIANVGFGKSSEYLMGNKL